ncbi:ABC superfamily ATP binding cassette transporter, ABC protein [Lactobacillus pasteurii DSM 23907 = CRBIP 24.76]|uniref:ABC-type quaternary amine transporter n=1 Tax=Lactobacillus pasteurii DSM 23907 = CRBIP 24.76 TaxID=1423790 RepID=I7IYK2_9LACO|nr:ABC transporter ATP-binding protein [Lactobacillus pasteurii]KRK07805.1 ABC superfamily ATP binding cassette transporter, ABC protein [Lactobacillus pasteurii DSM 23907 = CRBIP 24.76]TDG77472.1 hypothetical protein C5L33_000915 [Lactobacillus pasteurii]CCI84547.1 ABC superfamily ATP binding cassette transporter, ABC protein [Lactobacillus pasteurii DSM 23907 = CRBIP 24.76]
MANLEVKKLAKSYDGKNKILQDISFSVKDGELVSILGPSGCGKTTTLRIIAGLLDESSGQVLVDNKDVTKVPVYKRNFGMVFQSYALFPHLNIFENVAFGLKMHGMNKSEIKTKVEEILEITGLTEYVKKYPAQLSGGQQQRVSLARALVINPQLLLMDEPLSNLDAKLRLKMREEIRRLQQKLKMTVLFVTHDQQECFAISDRVMIMKEGKIDQFDTPQNIFHHPRTEYVARFIGYDNFIHFEQTQLIDKHRIQVKGRVFESVDECKNAKLLTIRPENIEITSQDEAENVMSGTIISNEYLGQSFKYRIKTDLGEFQVEESRKKMRLVGEQVSLFLPAKHLHALSE